MTLTTLLACAGCWRIIGAATEAENTAEKATADHVHRRVRVVDAATGEPIAGAKVTAREFVAFASDWISTGVTDEEGFVTLKVAEGRNYRVGAEASGYSDFPPGSTTRQPAQPFAESGVTVLTLHPKR